MLPWAFQAFVGDAGPGRTKSFSRTPDGLAAAAKWVRERRLTMQQKLALRNVGHRLGRRSLPAGAKQTQMPVGVTYSNGKWFARSPKWHHRVVVRAFSQRKHGRRLALKLALAVAKEWLHE